MFRPTHFDPDEALPVIILLHDSWQEPEVAYRTSGLQRLINSERFLVIAPTDGGKLIRNRAWRGGRSDNEKLVELQAEAKLELCVDSARMFIVGHGSAAHTVRGLECQAEFTALAVNSSLIDSSRSRDCRDPRPLIMLTPMNSRVLPTNGTPGCQNADDNLPLADVDAQLAANRQCHSSTTIELDDEQGSCTAWQCDVPFVSCRMNGGIPWGSNELAVSLGFSCVDEPSDFDAAPHIWSFFESVPPLELVR